MKQIIIKSVLLLNVLVMSAKAFAYDFEVNGIYYDVLSDTTCEVTKENLNYKYNGDIIIPEQVTYRRKIMRVTAIGGAAFSCNTGLTSVDIPNSVTTIGLNAFTGCTSLTSIDIPNSVEGIDWSAFAQSQALQVLRFPIPLNISAMERFMNALALQMSL